MMEPDPREAKTMEEACANGDGTFNGFRLMSWLSKAINPGGKGFSEVEVRDMHAKQIAKGKPAL